ncbi:hypothetical protein DEFDS_1649 [Deferribacter desulfuricans SSM1]|uniref:J domain-containing protein n=1 Tax=Deferribacter desulfuricans (strain DSM 14783 / JCM 11476 / NBRC 101012 / SSM1) TaxID=639282 RepID=D3P8R5_DEFDS|nr:DnaJ domain-containing protein [Deferribacter desulfuricans]BAI81105.1 hypothetical protein DEFDS_1649 [Deferribacter desulfuricans SSM1]
MDKKSFYLKILGLDSTATKNDIKRRYLELVKKYHPDVNDGKSDQFVAISKAYNYLIKNKDSDKAPDIEEIFNEKKENYKQIARKLYAVGVKYFREGDVNNALNAFEEAYRKDNNPKYKKWIVKCLLLKPRRLFDAKELCLELIREEPWDPENYVLLGDVYYKREIYKVANQYYKKAIEHGYPKEALKDKIVDMKKGFLSRLFRKNE